MKRFIIKISKISIFIFLILTHTQVNAEAKVITLASQTLASPIASWPEFHREIVKAAFNASGYKVEFVYMPWSRALKEVQKSTFDGAFAVWYTHERNEQFLLSSPYLTEDLVFIKSKANEISYDGDLSKLRDVTIGVVTGWTISPEFDSASYLNKYQVTSTEQLFEMLKQGRIDLVATSLQMYKGFNDKNQKDTFKKYINEFDVLANKLGSLSSHVAFPKSSPKSNLFKKSFEQGLKKIFLNKKLAKIEQKFGYKTGLPCY